MKFKIDYGYVSVGIEVTNLTLGAFKDKFDNPTTLVRCGGEINPQVYDVIISPKGGYKAVWTTQSGWNFSNIYDAIKYHLNVKNKPKAHKMYRFVYGAGSRAGMKRAAIIDEVSSTYVIARDLDTGETRNYSLSKISELEEIKV